MDPFYALTCGIVVLSLIFALLYPDRWIFTTARPDIPGPKGLPLLGNLLHFYPWRARAVEWMCFMLPQYRDLLTVTMPPWGRAIIIGRPEWLAHVKSVDMIRYQRGKHEINVFTEFPGKRIPLSSEGAEWRYYRRIMGPIFTVRSINEHVQPAITKTISTAIELLTVLAKEGLDVDWNDLSGRISLTIFCLSCLGLDTGMLRSDPECLFKSDMFRDSLATLNELSSRRLTNPFWKWTEKLTGADKRFGEARRYIYTVISDIVEDREVMLQRSASDLTADYVSQLLTSAEDKDPLVIRDTLVTLLFAGRDNTHNSLNWSMHSLLRHPEWLKRMRDEAIKLNSYGMLGTPFVKLNEYHIHQAVFYETVRLWPGIPKNLRQAVEDDILPALPELELSEVKIMKGDYVLWSDYYMMRHHSVWGEDAESFNPGRHLDAQGRFIKPKGPSFNGFGAGPRLCPAVQLVTYEFVAIWSSLLPQFDFRAKYLDDPKMIEAFTPILGDSLLVEVRIRDRDSTC